MTPDEIAALERQPLTDCPKCGWIHRATQPCRTQKWTAALEKKLNAVTAPSVDPFKKFQELADLAKEHPTTFTKTSQTCAGCGTVLLLAKNCLNIEFLVVGNEQGENYDIHQQDCRKKRHAVIRDELPDLHQPRRPYKDD